MRRLSDPSAISGDEDLEQGLIDEPRIILTPILLGGGKTVFDGIKKFHPLKLLSTKKFRSGNVVIGR